MKNITKLKSLFYFLLIFIFSFSGFFYNLKILVKNINYKFNTSILVELCFLSFLFSLYYFFFLKNLSIHFFNFIKIISPFILFLLIAFLIYLDVFNFSISHRFTNPSGINKHLFGLNLILFVSLNFLNAGFLLHNYFINFKKCLIFFLLSAFILYSSIAFWTTFDGDHGDEWVYRLMSQSFYYDFDFNLINNLEKKYFNTGGVMQIAPDKVYAKYYPLFPIIISPVFLVEKIFFNNGIFFLCQKIGSPIVPFKISFLIRIVNVLFSILIIYFFILLLIKFFDVKKINWFLLSLLFLLSPFSIYSSQIYPEIIAAFFLLIYFYIANQNKLFVFILKFIIILSLIWLHPRYIIISAILCIHIAFQLFRNKSYLLLLALVLLLCLNIFLLKQYQKFLPVSDLKIEGNIKNWLINFWNFERIKNNFNLTLYNFKKGLIFNFPAFLLIFFAFNFYKKNFLFSIINFLFAFFIFFMIFQPFIIGSGHHSPPLRFFIFLFPLILANYYYLLTNINNNLFKLLNYFIFICMLFNSIVGLIYLRIRFENIWSLLF